MMGDPPWLHRLLPHSCLVALLQPAMLTLVPMVLVDRAVLVPPALVRQVPSHRPLEKALAT